jgi:hypothetical protein
VRGLCDKKLGIREGFKILLISAPPEYRTWVSPLPAGVSFITAADSATNFVHAFATRRREVALPLGFVDVKVCAVTDVWSGLKLVVRKELREKAR